MSTTRKRGALVLLLAVALAAFCYRLGEAPLLDDPNESEYAEVAREMVESGDWLTPRLNYVVFLNKPPLEYWAIALSDSALGINEFAARLPSAVAGVVTVLLLVALGGKLYDAETGLLAGIVLFATGGFFLETHEAQPDLIMTASIVGTLLAVWQLFGVSRDGSNRRAPSALLFGLQVSVTIGLLAKGMLAFVLPGIVVAAMVIGTRRRDVIAQLLHPRAWWLLLVLMVPWHAAMSWDHRGFLWDYVINQHLLFFFDRKFPRDSIPVSLPVFWGVLGLRLIPWTVFAPLAVGIAARDARTGRHAISDRFVLVWAGGVLLFFSAAVSRMEHYSIPALPPMALLIARLFRGYAGGATGQRRLLNAHVVVLAGAALTGVFLMPDLIAAQGWLAPIRELPALARWTFILLAAGLTLASIAAGTGKHRWVAPVIAASMMTALPFFTRGMLLLARVNSSAPIAAALHVLVEPTEHIVYEAPTEYQNCAGFNFYLRRKIDLLRPPAFIAPPYVEPHLDELFISHDEFEKLWQDGRVFFISDPLQPRQRLDGVVPPGFYLVARDHERWVVSNRPL